MLDGEQGALAKARRTGLGSPGSAISLLGVLPCQRSQKKINVKIFIKKYAEVSKCRTVQPMVVQIFSLEKI